VDRVQQTYRQLKDLLQIPNANFAPGHETSGLYTLSGVVNVKGSAAGLLEIVTALRNAGASYINITPLTYRFGEESGSVRSLRERLKRIMSNLIIFDLDGVITSEEAYWDTAGLTLHELMCSPRYGTCSQQKLFSSHQAEESSRVSRSTLPVSEIMPIRPVPSIPTGIHVTSRSACV